MFLLLIVQLASCKSLPSGPCTEAFEWDKPACQVPYTVYLSTHSQRMEITEASIGHIMDANRRANSQELLTNIEQTKQHAKRVAEQIMRDHERAQANHMPHEAQLIKVVFFVHGGLRTISDGIPRIAAQGKQMLAEGYHPVFVNWRAGPYTNYLGHLRKWQPDDENNSGSYLLTPFVLATDAVSMIGEAPAVWIDESANGIRAMGRNDFGVDASESQGSPFEGKLKLPNDAPSAFSKRSLAWWVTWIPKIITTPMVNTVGQGAWDELRSRAMSLTNRAEHVADGQPSAEFGKVASVCSWVLPTGESTTEFQQRQAAARELCNSRGVVALFIRELVRILNQEQVAVQLTFVGHSMGSIVINNLLTDLPNLPVKRIVHMASADTVERVINITTSHLTRHPDAQAFNLYLHPDNESRETRVWGLAPSGSLLVWIDNYFNNPTTNTERTAGTWDNSAKELYRYPANVAPNVYHRVFNANADKRFCKAQPANNQCVPLNHGDFSSAPYWRTDYLRGGN